MTRTVALCLLWLWKSAPCDAFQSSLQKSRLRVFAIHAEKQKRNATSSNKRKPRFSQRVFQESQQSQSQSRREEGEEEKVQQNQAISRLPPLPQQPRIGNEDSTKKRRPPTNYISPRVPWNSGKSMEELESIMTKRWGTDSTRWSDGSDDDEEDDEIVNDDGDDTKDQDRNFFFHRPPPKTDFYDPDDVGYEPVPRPDDHGKRQRPTERASILRVDGMVAPRTAGGRGTKMDDAADRGFFFSGPSPDPARRGEPIEPPPPPKRGEGPSKPTLKPFVTDGETGAPLLLTLERAQRSFQAMLELSSKVQDDPKEDDGDPSWDTPSKSWEELGITSPVLLTNLRRLQCASPLAVQDNACPAILTGQDVLVGTYTGSGKTLAFLVPLIERVLFTNDDDAKTNEQGVQILVVVPGRELASQVVSVARQLLEGTGRTAMLAIGGTGFTRNVEDIRKKKPSIVVGTPGRIAELVVGRPEEKSGRLKVANLQSIVLDEFDALLEYKPHRDPTAAIVKALKQRHGDALQCILCSATATDMLGSPKLNQYLRPGFAQAMADRDDVFVTSAGDGGDDGGETKTSMGRTRVSRTVIHGVVHVEHRRFALETLRRILHTEPIPQQILVFVENPRKVDIIVEKLEAMGIIAAPLSGGSTSEKVDRAEVSKALREGYVGIVVATEMAARGLDAPLLTHVINFDLPTDASHYAHRAGRCGRGGRPGVVINLTTSPQERTVPKKFADQLGISMHTVEARAGKLHIVADDA